MKETNVTADLIAFIKARLDEDEQVATDQGWPEWVAANNDTVALLDGPPSIPPIVQYAWGRAPHIARHDPARVLRDVEAKRRVLAEHATRTYATLSGHPEFGYRYWCETCHVPGDQPGGNWCSTQRLLALPYSDHPSYRQEWAP